ncbi:MAG TPA: hypothetical protein VNI20_07300, partial [Fimbriimonadaceae bacterium]|nr:hypothetical protein [Fimbriimonadaceae bacterium]
MRLSSFIWFGSAALLLLLGCGGGGGGGGGGGQIAIAAPGQYIEFLRSDGTWFDPFNLQVGESGRAVIANYDSLGVRTVLPSSSWSTSFNDSTFISINPSTGKFSVVQAGGGPFFFRGWVTLGGAPVQLEQGARIPTDTPTVSGQVVEIDNFTGLPSTNGIPHVGVD